MSVKCYIFFFFKTTRDLHLPKTFFVDWNKTFGVLNCCTCPILSPHCWSLDPCWYSSHRLSSHGFDSKACVYFFSEWSKILSTGRCFPGINLWLSWRELTGVTLAASVSISPPFEVASEVLTEQRSARSQPERQLHWEKSLGAEGLNLQWSYHDASKGHHTRLRRLRCLMSNLDDLLIWWYKLRQEWPSHLNLKSAYFYLL